MPPETLLGGAGLLGGAVAMMVDGRRAVMVASVATGAGLLPTLASLGSGFGLTLMLAAMAAALLAGWLARRAALSFRWVAGLDPHVPAFAPGRQLFGPRSVRAACAALAVPAASWVSFNVPLGEVATVTGLLFPMAYVWTCGAFRLVVARTVEDLAVAVAMIGLAISTTWLVRAGADLGLAGAPAALAPAAAITAGWLSGRHERRPATSSA
jgi:hypothetical protein